MTVLPFDCPACGTAGFRRESGVCASCGHDGRLADEPNEPVHPSTPLCRGCAGSGVGHHVAPRLMQLIGGGRTGAGGGWKLVQAHKQDRYLRITAHIVRERCVVHAPFAVIVKAYDELVAKGFALEAGQEPPDASWACSWCSGTGQPQLSVATMENTLRAMKITVGDHPEGYPYAPDTLNAP